MNAVQVTRAKHSSRPDGAKNWLVNTRVFRLVYATHEAAIWNADRFARTGTFDPFGLVAVERNNP